MSLNLITMSEVETQSVRWLWYPYIPYGKITLVQGDPGDGKTTLVLAIAALLSKGNPMPESESTEEEAPQTVIYQTAEDVLCRGYGCVSSITLRRHKRLRHTNGL